MIRHPIQHKLRQISETFETRTAVEYGEKRLTYGDLEKRAGRIARQLLARGIRKQTFIGIFTDDRVGIISAMLGILKAGCVFVPLDPAHPAKRLERMIRAADLPLVICDTRHLKRLEALDVVNQRPVECRLLEDLANSPVGPGDHPLPDVTYSPEDKIYIYFTSGTTGEPKAVLGKNKSLLHFVEWEIGEFHIDETFRFSQFTTPGFDVFLRDVFVPLCAGATICVPEDRETIIDGRRLIAWLDEKAVTLSHCIPGLFRLVFSGDNLQSSLFKHLKYVLLAGEKIVPGELKNWYRVFGDRVRLVNIYGPTETTLAKLFYVIRPSDTDREVMPVGKPIKGARVVILDEKMEICDELVAGELHIRTPYRSFGYYNDPRLNSEKFIQNPFSQNPDDIIYKTGDRARLLPDGNIELLGRIDRQVKIRGMRVELEEIESLMISHPRVKEAVVIKKEMPNDIILLLAGITLAQPVPGEEGTEGDAPVLERVKDHLAEHLPDYMQPARITILERIPRKPNGKVAYDELPALLRYRETRAAAPRDEIEKRLIDTWSGVLGAPPPGVTDSFFELGGSSLNLMALVARIHKEFAVKITVEQAFNNDTVRKQARLLRAAAAGEFSAVEPAELKEYYPLSSAQKRLYILQQIDGTSTAYNLPRVVPLGPGMDREKIENAFRKLIQRHESLRTSFEMVNGEAVQRIHKHVEFAIEDHPRAESAEFLTPGFIRPFDLSRAPLLRVGLIETGDKKYLLPVDIHHIVSDGISLDLLERDFTALYDGEELVPLKLHYKDFSQWQTGEKEKEAIKKQEQYWLDQFEDRVPALDIPTDFPRPPVRDFSGGTAGFKLAAEEIDTLRALSLDRGATLFMVLLAVYTVFLSKISRQDDIVVGTAAAGRRHADLARIIGMFVNTLALRNFPEGDKSFTEFLGTVKERTLQAFENQDYPFEDLVEHLNVTRDTGRNPLFDTMFALNRLEENVSRESGERPEPSTLTLGANTAKFDLILTAVDTGKNLWFSLQYGTRLFTVETVERFITYFKRVVSSVCAAPSVPLYGIEIISPREKEEILYDLNKTGTAYPREKTIHRLFEEQVEKRPDNIAVIGPDPGEPLSLNYRQLNERSNRLAHRLIARGVGPDRIVGLITDRSIDMIIGIMGILKAGGAYLPIDPGHPVGRRSYMLKESGACLLVTHREYMDPGLEFRGPVIDIPDGASHENSTANPPGRHRADNLAYVIYTSGTTGRPRGVLTMHYNVVRVVRDTNYIGIRESDRLLQLSNYSFDGSVFDIYGALLNGAGLVLIKKEDVFAVENLSRLIKDRGVTVFFLTTALFNTLVDIDPGCLRGIRKILFGGERVSVEHTRKALQYTGKGKILHVYGPTETTVFATFYPVDEIPTGIGTIPIGGPLSNTAVYILDKHLNPVPIGIPGDLYVGGDGTARGYLNKPELTAERFYRSYKTYKSYILYKTGDLCRWLSAPAARGPYTIEFIGRTDLQVKIRGFRIELGEIENRLLTHPWIKEAAVFDHESDGGFKYLCAYIVSDEQFSVSQLSGYLSDQLPDFMIPSHFVRVDKIPLNLSGKVDRKALESYGTRIGTGVEYVEPAEGSEKIIADIWKEILEVDKVGIHDNFFDIGGNSLKIIQVNQKLKEVFNRDIPVVNLFRYTTVGALARSLDQQEEGDLFAGFQNRVQDEIEKGKETRKQRLQKRRGDII